MEITIIIDDSIAPDILQNAAISLRMNEVTDEQVKQRVGQDFAKNLIALARQGLLQRKRDEESAELDAAVSKVTVK